MKLRKKTNVNKKQNFEVMITKNTKKRDVQTT